VHVSQDFASLTISLKISFTTSSAPLGLPLRLRDGHPVFFVSLFFPFHYFGPIFLYLPFGSVSFVSFFLFFGPGILLGGENIKEVQKEGKEKKEKEMMKRLI